MKNDVSFPGNLLKRVVVGLLTGLESVWLALEAPLDSVLGIKDELFGYL